MSPAAAVAVDQQRADPRRARAGHVLLGRVPDVQRLLWLAAGELERPREDRGVRLAGAGLGRGDRAVEQLAEAASLQHPRQRAVPVRDAHQPQAAVAERGERRNGVRDRRRSGSPRPARRLRRRCRAVARRAPRSARAGRPAKPRRAPRGRAPCSRPSPPERLDQLLVARPRREPARAGRSTAARAPRACRGRPGRQRVSSVEYCPTACTWPLRNRASGRHTATRSRRRSRSRSRSSWPSSSTALLIGRAVKAATRLDTGELSREARTRLRLIRRLLFLAIILIGVALALSQFASIKRFATGVLASTAVLGNHHRLRRRAR